MIFKEIQNFDFCSKFKKNRFLKLKFKQLRLYKSNSH